MKKYLKYKDFIPKEFIEKNKLKKVKRIKEYIKYYYY